MHDDRHTDRDGHALCRGDGLPDLRAQNAGPSGGVDEAAGNPVRDSRGDGHRLGAVSRHEITAVRAAGAQGLPDRGHIVVGRALGQHIFGLEGTRDFGDNLGEHDRSRRVRLLAFLYAGQGQCQDDRSARARPGMGPGSLGDIDGRAVSAAATGLAGSWREHRMAIGLARFYQCSPLRVLDRRNYRDLCCAHLEPAKPCRFFMA